MCFSASTTLAPSHPHSLPILLQFRDELIALLHDIHILLILVIWAIRLDDLVDTIDSARNAIHGDKVAEVSIVIMY